MTPNKITPKEIQDLLSEKYGNLDHIIQAQNYYTFVEALEDLTGLINALLENYLEEPIILKDVHCLADMWHSDRAKRATVEERVARMHSIKDPAARINAMILKGTLTEIKAGRGSFLSDPKGMFYSAWGQEQPAEAEELEDHSENWRFKDSAGRSVFKR